MSKYHRIRWRDSDLQELTRVVNNFNAKLRRLEKKNPQQAKFLPKFAKKVYDEEIKEEVIVFTDRLSVSQLKELITTRQDLKREINALKRFSRRGAEEIVSIDNTDYNLKTTKWQRTEMRRRTAVINRRRAHRRNEIENFEATSGGEELGYKRGDIGMGKQTKVSLDPMNAFTPSMTQTSLKWKWASIMTESQSDYFTERDYAMRDNYLKGLTENYDWKDIKDVYEQIESMDIKEFLKIFYEEGGTFEEASPDARLEIKQQQYQSYVEHLKSAWIG